MSDAIHDLTELLREAGMTPTFDRMRDITRPCIICGEDEQPSRNLYVVIINDRQYRRPLCPGCARDLGATS